MKKTIFLLTLLMSTIAFSQVGIGTQTPEGILDVKSNNAGLVLPRVATASVINPNGGAVANGTIVYDTTENCVKVFQNGAWSDCLRSGDPVPDIANNCDQNGFVGTYVNGVAVAGASFSVTFTNNGFSLAALNLFAGDLVLSGVSGLTVGTPSPASITLNGGDVVTVTYPITGTPTSSGTLTGTWTKQVLNCIKTVNVGLGDATLSLPQIASVSSIIEANIQGVVDNTTNQRIVNVPYTIGAGAYNAYTSGWISGTGQAGEVQNFRISYPAGNFSSSGTIPVTIELDGDGTFNALKITQGGSQVVVTMPLNVNDVYKGDVVLRVISCGAPTTSGFKAFMCHNLGADQTADPFTPSWKLNGAYWQWGRKGPADQTQTANATNFAAAPTASSTNEAAVVGWGTGATDASWLPANDPCPSGYRVPTQAEWVSVTGWSDNGGTWTNSTTNYTVGKKVSNNGTTTLYLPAAGFRDNGNGSLIFRGAIGDYWTSTPVGNGNYYYLYSDGNGQDVGRTNAVPSFGINVRCIAK